MLISLAQWLQTLSPEFGFLRIFQYLTFRAVGAALTALMVGLIAGPGVIRRLTALKIGQPAVTKHVRRLEDQLGKALFQREARPVQLTAAGAHLLRLAQPLVEGIRDFSEPPAARAARTPVVLACTHGFMAEQLLDAVKRFRDRHPHPRLQPVWRRTLNPPRPRLQKSPTSQRRPFGGLLPTDASAFSSL